ncbi:MAG: pilus assembly protein PilM, partial [Pseudobdellovibrionaceae bacterium]
MRSIGIDVGSHGIKIIEITTTNKGFLVTQAIEKQFSLKAHQDHEIEVLEYLKELTQNYDDSTRVVICVPQEKIITRYKNFPFKDRNKILKSLAFELDEDLPYSSEDAIFDAKMIRTIGNTADVLACAVKQTQVEKIYDLFQSIGRKPDLMTAEGLAFANIFEEWNLPPPSLPALEISIDQLAPELKKLKVVLTLGYTKTLITAYHNEQMIAVQTIFWGGKNLIDSIAKKYELPFYEAKKETELKAFILPSKNNASFDAKIFSDTISKSFRDLVRDLQLALLEMKTEHAGEIQEIFLTGGLSHVKGLS